MGQIWYPSQRSRSRTDSRHGRCFLISPEEGELDGDVPPGLTKLAPALANKVEKSIRRQVPLGRLGTKTEIAMTCIFLVSPASRYRSNFRSASPLSDINDAVVTSVERFWSQTAAIGFFVSQWRIQIVSDRHPGSSSTAPKTSDDRHRPKCKYPTAANAFPV